MHFAIFFCDTCMDSWRNSCGITRRSFVTAFFMSFTSLKCVRLMTSLSLGKRRRSQGTISNECGGWSNTVMLFCPEIHGFSRNCVQEHCHDGGFRSFFPTNPVFFLDLIALNVIKCFSRCVDRLLGLVARTPCSWNPSDRKKRSSSPSLELDSPHFLGGLGDVAHLHLRLCFWWVAAWLCEVAQV